MLEEPKNRGDRVAFHRFSEGELYVEGVVVKVYVNDGEYYYEVAWDDGKNFGEIFYQGELDEVDTLESEALIRLGMEEFFSRDALEEWFEFPNENLGNETPRAALLTKGFGAVSEVALLDYSRSLEKALSLQLKDHAEEEDQDIEDDVDEQLDELFEAIDARSRKK